MEKRSRDSDNHKSSKDECIKDDRGKRRSSKGNSWSWLAPVGLVALLVGLYFLWPDFRDFLKQGYEVVSSGEQKRVERWVRGHGPWGIVVLLGLMLMQSIVAILPSIVTIVAAVLAYGSVWGALLAWAGMLMTAAFMFGIGRSLGPVTVDRMVGEKTRAKVERMVERWGAWAIVFARLTPIVSTDAISFVAGVVCMKFWRFMLATAVGTLPLVTLIAVLGRDMSRLKTGLVVLSVAAVLFFGGYLVYHWLQKRHGGKSHRVSKTAAA